MPYAKSAAKRMSGRSKNMNEEVLGEVAVFILGIIIGLIISLRA